MAEGCLSPIDGLSDDLSLSILQRLDHGALCQLAQVNKRFHALAASNSLWRALHTADWPQGLPVMPSTPLTAWRDAYRWSHQVNQRWVAGRRALVASREHSTWVAAVKLVSESGPVVSTGPASDVCAWSLTGDAQHNLRGGESGVVALWATLDGVAGGARDGAVLLWDLTTGTRLWERKAPVHAPVASVQLITPGKGEAPQGGGTVVMAATRSGRVQFWDARSGDLVQHLAFGAGQGGNPVEELNSCAWARAEGHLVLGLGLGGPDLLCLDRRRAGVLGRLPVGPGALCADLSHPCLVLGYRDGSVKVWNVTELSASLSQPPAQGATPAAVRLLQDVERGARALRAVAQPHARPLLAVRATPDWRVLSSAEDGHVCVCSPHPPRQAGSASRLKSFAPSLHVLHRLSPATDLPQGASSTFGGNGAPLRPSAMLCLDATQSLLAVGGRDALVRVYSHESHAASHP